MSKPTSRQTSKQGQSANKQSSSQNPKLASPAKKPVASTTVKQNTSAAKPPTRQAMRQERREEERQRQLKAKRQATRNKRILIGSLIAVVILVVAGVSYVAYSNTHNNASAQNQTAATESLYPQIDGINCDQLEQTAYHHHVHLTIYINGQPVPFPAGMGIAGGQTSPTCYYWLHTHATDGVIHIEAPAKHSFSLKNFLDIWQSFASNNSSGTQYTFPSELSLPAGWTMYVNGKKVASDFSKIDISSDQAWHELITLMYNSPNAKPDMPGSYNWPAGE